MAYSASYDLRAPLRHIDGFLKLLRMVLGNLIAKAVKFTLPREMARIWMMSMSIGDNYG